MEKMISALGAKPWLPLAAPFLVFVVTMYAGGSGSPTTFALFVCVSFVSAYFGGLGAGLVGTLLSALALTLQHAFFPPEAHVPHPGDLAFSILFFLLVGALASRLSAECLDGLRSATYFQGLLGGMHEAVVVTDGSGKVAFLNGAAEALTGWEGGTGVGQFLDTVVRLLQEEGRQPLKLATQAPGKSGPARQLGGPLLLLARGGAEKHVEFWSEAVPGRGTSARARLLVFRDVSEQLRAQKKQQDREELFRALTGCAGSGLLLLDTSGNCVYSNAACQKMAGLSSEEGLGGGWVRFVHPEDRGVAAEWMKAAAQGKPFAAEFRFQGEGGRTHWVQLHAAPARTAAGQVVGHVGSLEDVTQRKQLEQHLAEQKHAVEGLRRASHEKEVKAQEHVAKLEAAAGRLQEELAEAQENEETLRRQQAERQAEWERQEEKLRAEIADLTGQHESARGQLTEGQRKLEDLRREHAQHRADWERTGEQTRGELARAGELSEALRRQLAEARESEKQSHQRKQAVEGELRWREEAVARGLETLAVGLIVWQGADPLPRADATARTLLGLPEGTTPPDQWGQFFEVVGQDGGKTPGGQAEPFVRGVRREPFRDVELLVAPKAGGAARHLFASGALLQDAQGRSTGFVLALQDVTDDRRLADELRRQQQAERQRAEEEWARLLRTRAEHEEALGKQRADHEAALGRGRFLAEAGRELMGSLDGEGTLRAITRLAVPFLGSACVIQELQGAGTARPAAAAVHDSTRGVQLWCSDNLPAGPVSAGSGPAQVIEARKPALCPRLPEPEQAELHRLAIRMGLPPLRAGSAVHLPIAVKGEVWGVVSFYHAEGAAPDAAADVGYLEEFVALAGRALANSQEHATACAARTSADRQYQLAHSVTANLGESVCTVDGSGVVTFLNPAAERLLGWAEADLLGQPIDRILGSARGDGEVLATAEGGLLHALTPGKVAVKENVFFRRRGGEGFQAACTISAIEGGGGVEGAVLVIRDVTERLRRENQLQEQVRRLGDAGRWADGIVGRLAERVRPEIDRMQGTAEELKEAAPEGTWFLDAVKRLGKQLQGLSVLFDRLTIATRITRDDFAVARAPVEVSLLVGRAVELCEGVLQARQQHLTVYEPLEPEWVWVDAGLLRQALVILVENGTEHMDPGGEIELRVQREGDDMVFLVRDGGTGIAAEAIPNLQTLCARTRRFWNGRGDGLGIGLAVARSIVELHGGSVTVASAGPNQGSEVALRLPALKAPPPAGAVGRASNGQGVPLLQGPNRTK